MNNVMTICTAIEAALRERLAIEPTQTLTRNERALAAAVANLTADQEPAAAIALASDILKNALDRVKPHALRVTQRNDGAYTWRDAKGSRFVWRGPGKALAICRDNARALYSADTFDTLSQARVAAAMHATAALQLAPVTA